MLSASVLSARGDLPMRPPPPSPGKRFPSADRLGSSSHGAAVGRLDEHTPAVALSLG